MAQTVLPSYKAFYEKVRSCENWVPAQDSINIFSIESNGHKIMILGDGVKSLDKLPRYLLMDLPTKPTKIKDPLLQDCVDAIPVEVWTEVVQGHGNMPIADTIIKCIQHLANYYNE